MKMAGLPDLIMVSSYEGISDEREPFLFPDNNCVRARAFPGKKVNYSLFMCFLSHHYSLGDKGSFLLNSVFLSPHRVDSNTCFYG